MNTTLTEKTSDGSYVDWPAIFAGTVVAVAIGLLLTTFGAALGLSSITLDGTDNSSTLELVLTALWMVITLVASYLAGGYIGAACAAASKALRMMKSLHVTGSTVWLFGASGL